MPHLPAFQSFFSLPERARANRKLLTESEFVLWQALRGSQLGVKFRRQHVLSPFIVDFYAAGSKLVVEIDGAIHAGREARDAARVEQLAALHGVRVLRVGAAARRDARIVALVGVTAFRRQYERALRQFCRGKRRVEFPHGTWKMGHVFRACVAAPIAN